MINDIIPSIIEFFEQKEFGRFASTCREFKDLAYESQIQRAKFDAKFLVWNSPMIDQPPMKCLEITIDEPTQALYHMLLNAKHLTYLKIQASVPITIGKDIPPMPNLTCLTFYGAPLHMNGNLCPNLEILIIDNDLPREENQVFDLTETKLVSFRAPWFIPNVSQVLPPSIENIDDAEIGIFGAIMPKLTKLLINQFPQDIDTKCPNLEYLYFDSNQPHFQILMGLPKLRTLIPSEIDDVTLAQMSILPQITDVHNLANELMFDIDDFKKYLPHCDLYHGDAILVKRNTSPHPVQE